MNKKEISEIRRLLSKDHCRIDKICGYYVVGDDGHPSAPSAADTPAYNDTTADGEPESPAAMHSTIADVISSGMTGSHRIVMEMKEAFLSLPEEDMHKYCTLFRKTLSGTIGKNLMTLEFPLAEEAPDGRQAKLLALRDSELDDAALLHSFCEDLIASWPDPGNYLILFAFGRYDIPTRTKDNLTLDDASDDVYSFIVCSICPVTLSKAGLSYAPEQNTFLSRLQDHMAGMPDAGFLYPAFIDRNTDIHNLLYYTAKPKDLRDPLLTGALGIEPPLTAETQQSTFHAIIEETFARDCDFEVAKNVHERLADLVAATAEDPEPPVLDKHTVKTILYDCGATDEQMQTLETVYDELAGEDEIMVTNVHAARKFEVTAPDVRISLAADRTDLIETRIVDGREYLMIPLSGDVEVNGIRIREKKQGLSH